MRLDQRKAKPFPSHSKSPDARYHKKVKLTIDLDREEDGRWIARATPDEQLAGQ
jgi:hypothetical protein